MAPANNSLDTDEPRSEILNTLSHTLPCTYSLMMIPPLVLTIMGVFIYIYIFPHNYINFLYMFKILYTKIPQHMVISSNYHVLRYLNNQ